eukprot:ANDGO_07279.mRNA.1 hypothetical protein
MGTCSFADGRLTDFEILSEESSSCVATSPENATKRLRVSNFEAQNMERHFQGIQSSNPFSATEDPWIMKKLCDGRMCTFNRAS